MYESAPSENVPITDFPLRPAPPANVCAHVFSILDAHVYVMYESAPTDAVPIAVQFVQMLPRTCARVSCVHTCV